MSATSLQPSASASVWRPTGSDPLVALERARSALEAATDVVEVRDIRDRAEALRTYARTAGLGLEAQNRCAEIRIRAEHKAGCLIPMLVSHGGDRRPGARSSDATLADLGVSKSQSSRWQMVARLSDDELDAYLAGCISTGREITTGGVLSLVRPGGRSARSPAWPTDGSYRTILIDPPWRFEKTSTNGAAARHYPTMSTEELRSLPVAGLAAEGGSHLYLWTTNCHLQEALSLVQEWGFTYRTAIVWAKPGLGLGSYFRNSTELLLFGTRGSLPTLRADLGTWFEAARGRHSEKPAASYELIEAASPPPRIELFARRHRPAWDAWGAELEAEALEA